MLFSVALYAAGAAMVAGVLVHVAHSYTPFDSPSIVFLHDRLAGRGDVVRLLSIGLAIWTAAFLVTIAIASRASIGITRRRVALLLLFQAFLCIAFAKAPIAIDSDQFAYVGYAYASEQGNPYLPERISARASQEQRAVARHWGDPLPADRYGGAWTALNAALLYPFERSSLATQTGALRLAAIAAALAITVLLSIVAPKSLLMFPLVFALNPLVILETANGAHNDIFVALGGVAAAVLALRRRFGLAGIALGVATAVKFAYAPFIAILAAFAYSSRRRIEDALTAVAAFLCAVIFASAPYGIRHSLVGAPRESFERGAGALQFLEREASRLPLIGHHAVLAVDVSMLSIFLICIAILSVELIRGRFHTGFAILAAVVLLALAGKIEPWYAVMAVPLSLAGRTGLFAFAGITTGASVLILAPLLGSFPIVTAFAAGLAGAMTLYLASAIRARPAMPREQTT